VTVRVAVVGLAGMGGGHLRYVQAIDGYELTAVCDVVPDVLSRAAERTGAKAFSSAGELFGSGVADAVVIATPPHLHLEQVNDALAAGLHVYCEKPMVRTVAEADELVRLVDASGLRVQVGFQHRFQHSFTAAHELVSSGQLGALHKASLVSTNWFRPQAYFDARPWRGRFHEAGGGVLMNQAIHHVDSYLWIVGNPVRVTAQARRAMHHVDVEDDVWATLQLRDGAVAHLTASTAHPIGADRLEIACDGGAIESRGGRLRVARLEQPAREINDTCPDAFPRISYEWHDIPAGTTPVTYDDCVRACHQDFLDCISSGRQPLNNPRQASRSIELANAVYISTITGEPVDLPVDRGAYDELFGRLAARTASLPGAV
jgi:predicted dehydrogenase